MATKKGFGLSHSGPLDSGKSRHGRPSVYPGLVRVGRSNNGRACSGMIERFRALQYRSRCTELGCLNLFYTSRLALVRSIGEAHSEPGSL